MTNLSWAKEIIQQLIFQGVDYFCLSPGSRATPLVVALAQNSEAKTFVHYDERGCAFHALGAAKASGKPVAIITTSGTATGNLFPAVMEACASRIPLILLTADRPPELRETHANQTLDQVRLFGNYVRWHYDLPCPGGHLPPRFLATSMAQAVHLAKKNPQGPVHLNCMFREPFFTEEGQWKPEEPCYFEESSPQPKENTLLEIASLLSEAKRGVIFVGSYHAKHSRSPLIELARTLDWPLFADIDSGLRSYGRPDPLIPFYDLIFKTTSEIEADVLLHFGDRSVSKAFLEWTSSISPKLYCQVADHPFRADPKHLVTHRISCDPSLFAEKLLPLLQSRSSWLRSWKNHAATLEAHLDFQESEISEPGIIRWLVDHVSPEYALFFGNGMPVRDAEGFFYPSLRKGPIFTNRGASGIDGNIATVVGLSEGAKKPLIAVMGDQTALHDLNSIAQLKKTRHPVILFLINNGGSGIFSFLPVHQHTSAALFEEFFAASHPFQFEHAALLFNIPYYHPESWQELSLIPLSHSCIVEFTTDRARNLALHKEIQHQCIKSYSISKV